MPTKPLKQIACWILVCCFLPALPRAQEFSYTNYDSQHGLAGSTVFCMLQDKQGFLWFGTETGVSRFDGTRFRNFSTVDGLPDNQVLSMFEDSRGRIWMSPFNKSICYYYKGKIYNQHNDSLLGRLSLSGYVITVTENSGGDILLHQASQLYILKRSGGIVTIKAGPHTANVLYPFVAAGVNADGEFSALMTDSLFYLRGDTLQFQRQLVLPFINYRFALLSKDLQLWRNGTSTFMTDKNGVSKELRFDMNTMYKFSLISDSLFSINTPGGAYVYDLYSGVSRAYLPSEAVSTVYRDNEGNLWFCTLSHGVFMLNSSSVTYVKLKDNGAALNAYCLAKSGKGWLAGSDMVTLFSFNSSGARPAFRLYNLLPERITAIAIDENGKIILGTDSRLTRLKPGFGYDTTIDLLSVKAICQTKRELYVADGRQAYSVDLQTFTVREIFWRERSTAIYFFRDTIYIGTLDGLFLVLKDRSRVDFGKRFPQFRNRIMAIRQSADSTLWIATFSGVFGLRDGRIIASLTEQDGLISNICRTLEVQGNELWIGTDKGLQRVDITNAAKPAVSYALTSELASRIVNSILVDGDTLLVATAEGVNIIDKRGISFNSATRLYLDDVLVSGRSMRWNGPIRLPNSDNNIRFEFAGISYRSVGGIHYEYRLVGLDNGWRQTRDNYLNYPTLPGGRYELQMVAVNKFGVRSPLLRVPFSIEKELWQKLWFQLLAAVLLIGIIWLVLHWRIRSIRRQEAEKSGLQKRIVALEQLALKAQMNPHFIFNSLNSIQQYVLDKDIEGANKFISGFSRLIRQTLDISAKQEISLADEVSYLSTYLELERVRLENKFSYEVAVDPAARQDELFIPPMILQPFVENCIRHGIRLRNDSQGKITVTFKLAGAYLETAIEDNGVGRRVAAMHKGRNVIEYQSKGISLTTDRIELINKSAPRAIYIDIHDLEEQGATGTRVVIHFPLPAI